MSDIIKIVVSAVEVESGRIVAEIGFYDSLMPTVVVVGGGQSHASLHGPIFAVCHTRLLADIGKCAVMVIVVENVWCGIARDVDIGPAITIEVSRHRSQPVTSGSAEDARLLRDVGERAVAIVV